MSVKSTPEEMEETARLYMKGLGHSEERTDWLLTQLGLLRRLMNNVDHVVFLRPGDPTWPESTLGIVVLFREDVEKLAAQGKVREGMGGPIGEKDYSKSTEMLPAILFCAKHVDFRLDDCTTAKMAQWAALTPDRPPSGLLMTVVVSDALLNQAKALRARNGRNASGKRN